jgi:hypothetical protein
VISHPLARNTNGPSTLKDSDWVEVTSAMLQSTPGTNQDFPRGQAFLTLRVGAIRYF